MHNEQIPTFIDQGQNKPNPDLPFIERDAVTVVLRDPKTKKYLGLKWKQVDWDTFVTGGIEEGQSAEDASRAEVYEETGYKNIKLISKLPSYHSKFFHPPKGVNRFAHFQCFLFELVDDERDAVSDDEKSKHQHVWLTEAEMRDFRLPEGHRFVFDSILNSGF